MIAVATRGFDAHGMRVDTNGDLLVADYDGSQVRKLVRNSPKEVVVSDGDQQTAEAGTALLKPLKVLVNGRGGLGVANEPVTFKVTAGDATLSSASVPADASGMASVIVVLGSAGTVTITATVNGLAPLTFTAIATPTGLSAMPDMLAFSYTLGSDAPDPQMISVSGPTKFSSAAAVDGDIQWLAADVVDGGVAVSLANLDQLAVGSYNGTVSIVADGVDPKVVPVVLTVSGGAGTAKKTRPVNQKRLQN